VEAIPAFDSNAAVEVTRPRYIGTLADLYLLAFKNIALSIFTLGLYRFWGRTQVRKYLWSNLLLWDEPLEYNGTGGELFWGFVKALLVLVPFVGLFAIASLAARNSEAARVAIVVPFELAILFVVFYAGFSARRYRLSRTLWRGIRFGQQGSAGEFAALCMKNLLLSALTLGFYLPYASMSQHAYVWNRTQLGNRDFQLRVRGGDMFGRFLWAWLLAVPTFGLSLIWYFVGELRYVCSRLKLGRLEFELSLSTGEYLGFLLVNVLILILTFGLGQPIVVTRVIRFACERLQIRGREEWGQFAQGSARRPSSGEGLLSLLDADIAS
jgi:uncharacterized membrane protein YjgN (DUF898 family)